MTQVIETAPEVRLTPQDVDSLLGEVETYQGIYSPLFQRHEQREKSQKYLYGLLAPEIENKAIEPMMLALEGDDQNEIRAMQHFISEGAWDDLDILRRHWHEVAVDLGEENGVFTLDGSDFPKQGTDSVGVKRQHCGELGKIANCQAGVFVGYASSKGYTLLHSALYLPEEWVKDKTYAELRGKCGVPERIEFRTKLQLGLDMLQAILAEGALPGRWLACDEAFGRSSDFLDQVADLGLWYYAEVPHDTRVWRARPLTHVPEWSGKGRKPTRGRLIEGEPTPQTVRHIADALSTTVWARYTIKEGSKGPLVADFAFLRVVTDCQV